MPKNDAGRMHMTPLNRANTVLFLKEKSVNHGLDMLSDLSSFKSPNKKLYSGPELDEMLHLAKLVDIFHEIDDDNSGTIDKEEIMMTMKKLGYKSMNSRQIDLMMKKVDADGNGEIDLEEFTSFFRTRSVTSMNALAEQWAEGVVVDVGGEVSPSLPPSGLEVWQTVIAGGCGGVASRTLTAPLEKVKLAAQAGTSHRTGVYRELSHIARTQGVKGLFAGNFLNSIRVFPTSAIVTTVYLNLLTLTPADEEFDMMEPVYRIACAGVAAFIANTITYPLDVIRVRLTLADSKTTPMEATRAIYAKRGFSGFYRGLKPMLYAVVPFIALQNTSIDLFRDHAIHEGLEVTPLLLGAVGAGAGIVAQTFVYPLDVLRRRLQVECDSVANPNKELPSKHLWTSVRHLVRDGGVKSLFAGLVPTYLKIIPTVAIFASVSQSLNVYFKRQNAQRLGTG